MPNDASHYPIVEILNDLIEQFGPSRAEFVHTLGYRNVERGLRRLEPWLVDGQGFEKIIKQIAASYPGHADEMASAIAATKDIKDAEWDATWLEQCRAEADRFRPFIYAVGERTVPSGICIFAVSVGIGAGPQFKFQRPF